MLVIRLARHGRKNKPTYRVVLQEKDWAPSSKVLENLGNMNPHTNPATVSLNTERIKYWIGLGAQPSNTMHNMLINAGVITGEKRRSVTGNTPPTAPVVEAAKPAEAPAEPAADLAAEAPAKEATAPEATPAA